jgi:hypothetical protein
MRKDVNIEMMRLRVNDLSCRLNELMDDKNTNEGEALEVMQQQNQNIDFSRQQLDKIVYKLGKSREMNG